MNFTDHDAHLRQAAFDHVQGGNLLIFGTGKTHLAAAFGTALVDEGKRVLFTRTTDWKSCSDSVRLDRQA